jgi:hypothetical protein
VLPNVCMSILRIAEEGIVEGLMHRRQSRRSAYAKRLNNLQYHKLPRFQRQNRHQRKCDHKERDGGEVEAPEDQKAIPPTHYATCVSSRLGSRLAAVAERAKAQGHAGFNRRTSSLFSLRQVKQANMRHRNAGQHDLHCVELVATVSSQFAKGHPT